MSHRLLGLSAFAGFLILLAGWPLNSFIARRSIRIQKGVLSARDKRMGVLNELIGAVSVSCPSDQSAACRLNEIQVKFIKFFAWEERWIDRALDAREAEMKWMVKGVQSPVVLYESELTNISRQPALIRSCFTFCGHAHRFSFLSYLSRFMFYVETSWTSLLPLLSVITWSNCVMDSVLIFFIRQLRCLT